MPVSEIIALLESRMRRGLSHLLVRLLLFGLARSLTVGGAVALAALLVGVALAGSPHVFLPLAAGTAITLAAVLVRYVVVPWLTRPDLPRFARLAEGRLPELRSLLVNALELAPVARGQRRAAGDTSRELAAALLAQAEQRSRAVDFARLAPRALPLSWGRALFAVTLAWLVAFAVAPGPMRRAGWSLLHPRQAHAAAVSLSAWPGDVTLPPGATLHVGARVGGAEETPTLVFRSPAGERRVRMQAGPPPAQEHAGSAVDPGGQGRVYQAALTALAEAGEYRVELLGRVTPPYRVRLSGSAAPVSFEITYRYPGYTRLPAETQAATRADLVALRGTRATVVVNLDRAVEAVSWTLGSALRREGARRWVGETVISRDGPYELTVGAGGDRQRLAFRTEAVPDRMPLLAVSAPAGDQDLPAGQRIPIAVSGSDDFGLTRLALAYEREGGTGGRVVLASWRDEPRDVAVQTEWDLSGLSLLPGQSVSCVLELTDNDRVSGPKTTRSARFTVRFPTLSEVYERIEDQQASAADRMEKALAEARELAKQVQEARRELQNQSPRDRRGDASWDKRQQAKEAAERQEEIARKMEEITRQLEEASRQASEHQAFRQDVLAKMQEISKLVAELQSPELKEAIRRLQESLQQVDPRRLEANLRQLQNAQDQLLKGLERTLELLKRVRQEEQLESAARRAEELARREEALEKQMSEARSAEERERQAAAQEQAARESQSLQEDLERLSRELAESRESKASEQAQQGAETLDQQAQPAAEQSASEMRQSRPGSARQNAQRAQQAFRQVAQQLEQARQQMSDDGQRQMAQAVRRSAQDLVDLSQRQEQALSQPGESRQRAQRQQDLHEGASRVGDDLMDLAKRTPFFPPDAQRSLGQALEKLDASERAFAQGNEAEGERQGQAAGAAMNQTVVQLRQAEQSMCQGGQESGGESPSQQPGQKMQALSGQQGELNQDTQSMIQRLTQQQRLVAGDQEALERLAARQEAIRRGIEETESRQDEGEILGKLDQAKKDMEEVTRDLRQGKATDEVVERQNRILSRLLDAQRSVNRREFDERRESRSGEDVTRVSPPELPRALMDSGARTQRDLLRARSERYPAEYRDLVESYLRRLQGDR